MLHFISFQIFKAGVVQTLILWVLTLCSVAGWNRCFEEMWCLYLHGSRNWYRCDYHEDEVILHMQTAKNRVNHNQMMRRENFLIYILICEVYHSLFTSHPLKPTKVPHASMRTCTHTHTHTNHTASQFLLTQTRCYPTAQWHKTKCKTNINNPKFVYFSH
jgi:hypothetical protein